MTKNIADNETCYYCGKPATSREHAPPRSFFPDSSKLNLITVPSCDIHNGRKSKDDEYVRALLVMSILLHDRPDIQETKDAVERSFHRAAERAIKKIDGKEHAGIVISRTREFKELYGDDPLRGMITLGSLIKDEILPPSLLSTVIFDPQEESATLPDGTPARVCSTEIDIDRLATFFNSLARAIYYHTNKAHYDGPVRLYMLSFFNEFITQHEAEYRDMVAPLFVKEQAYGENKDIFYYDIYNQFLQDGDVVPYGLIVNFCLYDVFKVSALFKAR